jgi:hypothetical protein
VSGHDFRQLTKVSATKPKAAKSCKKHWALAGRAKAMLDCIEKLNPDFYPIALEMPKVLDNGVKHCDRVPDGFFTRAEFELLYDKSS